MRTHRAIWGGLHWVRYCTQASSGCSAWVFHCRGFTDFRACQLQYLWCMGLAALKQVEFSRTRDQTHVLCIGRWILNHWINHQRNPTCGILKFSLTRSAYHSVIDVTK